MILHHHLFLFPQFLTNQTSLLHSGKVNAIVFTILLFMMYLYITFPPLFRCISRAISSISIPKSYQKALNHIAWNKAMEEKMHVLLNRGAWELLDLPQWKINILIVQYPFDSFRCRYENFGTFLFRSFLSKIIFFSLILFFKLSSILFGNFFVEIKSPF